MTKNCCVVVTVEWFDQERQEKRFWYCLHCGSVLSRSGFFSHKETFFLAQEEVERRVLDFLTNEERHKRMMKVEFERRFDNGRMRGRSLVEAVQIGAFNFVPELHQEDRPVRPPQRMSRIITPRMTDDTTHDQMDTPPVADRVDVHHTFPDLMDCFSSEGFDPRVFEEFTRLFLSQLPEMTREEIDHLQNEKAKVVSVLAQNLYIMCTFTKDQIKNVTAFWKAMISFISPESASVAKKIHVSYSSCVREAQRRHGAIEATHLQMFRDCLYFSLALDTARFGQDNFLCCVGRFGFDDRIDQVILFFERIAETTGLNIARFIFDRLSEKNCDFTKLISITTDGASNMIGQTHGMANELLRMANEKCGSNRRLGVDVHSLWCLDHRLNLVVQDFKEVENINFVLKFLKWFTTSDRLVSYTAFARMMSPDVKKKKIPAPSETRWLFFRDTLRAVLDQTDLIEAFMRQDNNIDKWTRHISTSKHPWDPSRTCHFPSTTPSSTRTFGLRCSYSTRLGN